MAPDLKVNSLDLLRQYQTHLRNFANCVDVGVVAFRDKISSRKDKIQRLKQEFENRARVALERQRNKIRQLENLEYRFTFGMQDAALIEVEKNRYISDISSLESRINSICEKYERQISTLDDLINLTYSYGIRCREMADSANGSLTRVITDVERYKDLS